MRIESAPVVLVAFPTALPKVVIRMLGGADKITFAVRYKAADAAATLHALVSWVSPSGVAYSDMVRNGAALTPADWTFAPGDVAERDLALEWEVPAGFAAQSATLTLTESGAALIGSVGVELGARAEDVG